MISVAYLCPIINNNMDGAIQSSPDAPLSLGAGSLRSVWFNQSEPASWHCAYYSVNQKVLPLSLRSLRLDLNKMVFLECGWRVSLIEMTVMAGALTIKMGGGFIHLILITPFQDQLIM
jgi:hypothetical protein